MNNQSNFGLLSRLSSLLVFLITCQYAYFSHFIRYIIQFLKLRNSRIRQIVIKAKYLIFGLDPLYLLVNNIQLNIRLLNPI